jgi:hypothetical protein
MTVEQSQEDEPKSEQRDGLRIETELWVRVVGRDHAPSLRSGNICGSGFFFEIDRWAGRPGDIGVMEVSSEDQSHTFTTMASLARVIGADEAQSSSTRQGVSYEFLPSDEATRVAIARTVRHIAEEHPEQLGVSGLDAFGYSAPHRRDRGQGVIGGSYIEAGTQVHLIVDAELMGGKREVQGVVGDITESSQADGTTRFWVPVYVEKGVEGTPIEPTTQDAGLEKAVPIDPTKASSDEKTILDEMWTDLVPKARSILEEAGSGSSPTGKSHLSGRLSQISMPSALWLLDQERLSGVLEFRRENELILLYLREGSVIDADSPSCEREPREHLAALMAWQDGAFEFRVEAIDRPDRLGVPTQGLLLDLAVASDEMSK